jgi:uncharacterized protein
MNDEKIILRILVKPNAKHSALIDIKEGILHIALHAKPSEGEANRELCRFLSKLLGIPKTKIILERGEKSRHKRVSLPKNDRLKKILENTPD